MIYQAKASNNEMNEKVKKIREKTEQPERDANCSRHSCAED